MSTKNKITRKNKKTVKNNDNKIDTDNQFEKLKQDYISISKEICSLQIEINKKDDIRSDILKEIRKLQNSLIDDSNLKLVLNYNENLNNDKISIKSPLRQTDKETDDDESENLSNLDSEDSETDSE